MERIVKYSGHTASVLFISIAFIICLEVILRYIFNSPTIWVEEMSRFLQIWATYLALTFSFHHNDLIRITFVYDRLSNNGKKILDIISFITIIIFSAIVVYYGWLITVDSFNLGRTSATMIAIPKVLTEISIPLCFGLLIIRVFLELIKHLKDFSKK